MKETPSLKILVVMETISEEVSGLAKQNGVTVVQYSEMEASCKLINSYNKFFNLSKSKALVDVKYG